VIYLIHCKNLCKCYHVSPPSIIKKKKKGKKKLRHPSVYYKVALMKQFVGGKNREGLEKEEC
jgi:hypothetical protein